MCPMSWIVWRKGAELAEVFILGMLLAKLRQLLDVHARSLPHGTSASWVLDNLFPKLNGQM